MVGVLGSLRVVFVVWNMLFGMNHSGRRPWKEAGRDAWMVWAGWGFVGIIVMNDHEMSTRLKTIPGCLSVCPLIERKRGHPLAICTSVVVRILDTIRESWSELPEHQYRPAEALIYPLLFITAT
jgi:hypothetical protein